MKHFSAFIFLVLFIISSCGKTQSKIAGSSQNKSALQNIRVLTYNIHHANPPSKPNFIDVAAIAKVINDQKPDLVALQELDVYTNRSGKQLNEAEAIAQQTGMHVWFGKAIDYDSGSYGIAILSKYPMAQTQKFALPTINGTKGEPRILATAVITLPGNKKVRFACTHLDAQRSDTNRIVQVQKIMDILKSETLPVIIAGDFNATPNTPTINTLDTYFVRTCITGCGFTIPQINPNKTIDYIATRSTGFKVVSHEVINEQYASDHLPVLAVLQLSK